MRRLAAAAALAALSGCGAPEADAARFGAEDCRRVSLRAPDGRALVGIEDVARAPGGAGLLLSAYDRRAPERAPGGLFRVALAALTGGEAGAVALAPDGPRRPHGIAAAPDGRFAVVARDGAGGAAILTGAFGPEGLRLDGRAEDPAFCRANDVAFVGGALAATLDRRDCGPSIRDLRPGARTGRLVRIGSEGGWTTLRAGLAFANGVAAGPGGAAVAETRGARVALADGRAIPTPGHPDNLTASGDGALLAALHPSPFRLWLALSGLPVRPGSRIARIDLASGATEILFDDPDGALFSAATVAVPLGAGFAAGSAIDAGLLICGQAA